MDIHLGTLEILPAQSYLNLLALPVANFLSPLPKNLELGVAEIDPDFSDTAAFCKNYQVNLNQAANCIVLEAKRGDKTWFAACVVLANTRADVNGLARRILDARKVSFAQMELAVLETSMEYGAITPVGLPSNWPILIDKAVADSNLVTIGSGIRKSKLIVPGSFLSSLPNTQVLEGLGREAIN
jgi:prolyl-tRNA editing enzyme YbaK/EbsC (Cys-tRNA(Pro) deacylase)